MTMTTRWIPLDGADNVRDLGGLPIAGGGHVRPRRLIRADSLQALTASDVRHLVDDVHVRAVADLRTGVEVASEGPDPMTREPLVDVRHLSFFPEPDGAPLADADARDGEGPVLLPWQERDRVERENVDDGRRGASAVYLRYLDDRADSVLGALRLVAYTDGATIVHCAAGKDRTGVLVAMALTELGVPRDEVAADYALSSDRVGAILTRLARRRTYAGAYAEELTPDEIDKHKPRAVTMDRFLDGVDAEHGGVRAWLRTHGWTDDDAEALRAQLAG